MKYMILIYGNVEGWKSMNADSFAALMAAHGALKRELTASGELIDTNELPVENAKIVRTRGGVPEVTDGPFVEIKEIVAGYYIVDCDGIERATQIAGRLAEAEFGLVEVRQMTSDPPSTDMLAATEIEGLLKQAAPRVLGSLMRLGGRFETCEDAVQEALLAAYQQWPTTGVPRECTAWLVTVARRRLIDQQRAEVARARREIQAAELSLRELEASETGPFAGQDDTLNVLFLCCHPSLTPTSQVALTLRAAGGLTTAQIASSFLVSEANMAQRITRAKLKIRQSADPFRMQVPRERLDRLRAVQHVLYLIFNEGYLASCGPQLQRTDLAAEGIRLARLLATLVPDDGESVGLLALMLLIDSRTGARTGADGNLVTLADQDRQLWDHASIREGTALVTDALGRLPLGPYQVQASIAALHAEATSDADTDWAQILALYEVLEAIAPNPMASLGQAVAAAMIHGPAAGLARLALLDDDERLAANHRVYAVRAHFRELLGDDDEAHAAYLTAAGLTGSEAERAYLTARASRLMQRTSGT